MPNNEKLKILFVSAEVSPYAKTGGLADVAESLPQQLDEMGHDIRIVMPKYKSIRQSMVYVADFPVRMHSRTETCILRKSEMEYELNGNFGSLPVYFTDNYHYFNREGIYCYSDDGERFAFFCNAVLEMLPVIDFKPDIIHCNDWHTGPVCMLLKEKYAEDPYYNNIASIFTIHNLEYQGHFSREILKYFNVNEDIFIPEKVEFYGNVNFLKAGMVYCDIITTVSNTYAEEIKTNEFGMGLEGVLQKRSEDLFGIVNGISCTRFNPEKDTAIAFNYDKENYTIKYKNKSFLQREMGLPVADLPILGMVTRLADQKGLDLIIDVFVDIMKRDLQFVLLGMGNPYYENTFRSLEKKYPEKVKVSIEFNPALAQRIYAGSDIFLMPSRFEPCGLGQIIGLRYGTIPVVRKTGGLADTIVDFDEEPDKGNGFVFESYDSKEMLNALNRALHVYYYRKGDWSGLVRRALEQDFSWRHPARKYCELYLRAKRKNMDILFS